MSFGRVRVHWAPNAIWIRDSGTVPWYDSVEAISFHFFMDEFNEALEICSDPYVHNVRGSSGTAFVSH